MPRHPAAPSLRRPLAALLLCAMLCTQWLGLVHRIEHGGGPAAARLVQIGHGAHDSLFGAHHSEADCRLFDHLSHADAAGFVADLPAALPQHDARPMPGRLRHAMAPPGAYLARGPPRLA